MRSLLLFVFLPFCFLGQDSLRYRCTSFHASLSDFILLGAKYPSIGSNFPSAGLSVKSWRTDSAYSAAHQLNFSLLMGAAASRYLFFDERLFTNFIDKSPYHVLSKRFWGGFGVNYRKPISQKLILDVDVAPTILIIVDKSDEAKYDTAGWSSITYENIYQGLQLNLYAKLEYKTKKDFHPFLSIAVAVPVINSLARAAADEPYHNHFKGQLFIGAGIGYFLKTRHFIDPGIKRPTKK